MESPRGTRSSFALSTLQSEHVKRLGQCRDRRLDRFTQALQDFHTAVMLGSEMGRPVFSRICRSAASASSSSLTVRVAMSPAFVLLVTQRGMTGPARPSFGSG